MNVYVVIWQGDIEAVLPESNKDKAFKLARDYAENSRDTITNEQEVLGTLAFHHHGVLISAAVLCRVGDTANAERTIKTLQDLRIHGV